MSEQVLVKDEIPEPSMVEPGEVQYLTDWQIEENKKCFDKVNGPLYFLGNYCYVNCGKMIKFELRPYTTELIYCIHNFDRFLGMLGRQMGKCFLSKINMLVKKDNVILEQTIDDILNKIGRNNYIKINDKKFTKEWDIDDYEILTDTGWIGIEKIYETVPYNIWKIKTTNHELECADTHILFRPDYEEVFVKDLKTGDKIITECGDEEITSIEETDEQVPMYDVSLPLDSNHRFYSNGILSHNTTTCCLYALWLAMFNKDQQVLLTSYNYDQTVLKNMATIKTAYEYCPKWLKEPVLVWNESRIKFASGSEIIAKTTTEDCVRGTSPNLIYADELAWTFKGSSTSQLAFYTSVFPALSASKGKLAITSTPQSSMDLFGTTWENANKFDDDDGKPLPCVYVLRDENNAITDLTLFTNKEDAEKYNNEHPELNSKVYERHGKGYNDFVSYRAIWADVPGRTESWKQSQIKVLGEQMFLREYECLSGEEVVSIRLPNGEIRNVTLRNLYQYYGINLN